MNRTLVHEHIFTHARFVFSRSGGKGGQNVNKVNTKVHVFLPVAALPMTEAELFQLRKRLEHSINAAGELFIAVQEERTQERNRDIALERLETMIVKACRIKKIRHKTKPTASSREKRLHQKKQHSASKTLRQRVDVRDY